MEDTTDLWTVWGALLGDVLWHGTQLYALLPWTSWLRVQNTPVQTAFVDDRADKYGRADWLYQLTGLHTGPPLCVWVCNVREEFDSDDDGNTYHHVAFDTIRWLDDDTEFDNYNFIDAYEDVLHEAVREDWQV